MVRTTQMPVQFSSKWSLSARGSQAHSRLPHGSRLSITFVAVPALTKSMTFCQRCQAASRRFCMELEVCCSESSSCCRQLIITVAAASEKSRASPCLFLPGECLLCPPRSAFTLHAFHITHRLPMLWTRHAATHIRLRLVAVRIEILL